MLLISSELVLVFGLLILLQIAYKSSKKIWQKIAIVYNQIYEKLIAYFYATDVRKDLLKSEIIDFYKNVVAVNDVNYQQNSFNEIKWFVKELLGKRVKFELDQLDGLYEYYNSISRLVYMLGFMSLLLLISIIVFWILTY
jgi:hypothetical protein